MSDEKDNIELSAPGGFKARFTGAGWTAKEIIIIIIIFVCTAFLHFESIQDSRRFVDQHLVTQRMLSTVLVGQVEIVKEIRVIVTEASTNAEVQTYVLSLSQGKREQLNLSMPQALRNRIRSNSQ